MRSECLQRVYGYKSVLQIKSKKYKRGSTAY